MNVHCSHDATILLFDTFFEVIDRKFSLYEKRDDLKHADFFVILSDDDPVIEEIVDYIKNRSPRKEFLTSYFDRRWSDGFCLVDGFFSGNNIPDKTTAMFLKIKDVKIVDGTPFLNSAQAWGTILFVLVNYGIVKMWKDDYDLSCLIDDIVDFMGIIDSNVKEYDPETIENVFGIKK